MNSSLIERIVNSPVDQLIVTTAPSAAERAWDLEEVANGESRIVNGVRAIPDLKAALSSARDAGGTVLVTGSFHTVGDAMALLPGFSQVE